MNRPKKIDETNIFDHHYLTNNDKCYYFFDYSIGKGVTYSPGNQLILNLKKSPLKKNTIEWKYKEKAIDSVAKMIWEAFGKHLSNYFITAIPPSKSKNDPEYDDRILKVIEKIKSLAKNEGLELSVGEIFESKETRTAMHSSPSRWNPEQHSKNLKIISKEKILESKGIIIIDDVLITGAQYKGACISLENELIQLPVFGIFIARGVR
jgi:hypothetical protein